MTRRSGGLDPGDDDEKLDKADYPSLPPDESARLVEAENNTSEVEYVFKGYLCFVTKRFMLLCFEGALCGPLIVSKDWNKCS